MSMSEQTLTVLYGVFTTDGEWFPSSTLSLSKEEQLLHNQRALLLRAKTLSDKNAALIAAEADAERYRWLRDRSHVFDNGHKPAPWIGCSSGVHMHPLPEGSALDSLIDECRAKDAA